MPAVKPAQVSTCAGVIYCVRFTVFGVAEVVEHKAAAASFAPGQQVLVEGREATFCYAVSAGAAVIRYDGETATKVVPANKLAALFTQSAD